MRPDEAKALFEGLPGASDRDLGARRRTKALVLGMAVSGVAIVTLAVACVRAYAARDAAARTLDLATEARDAALAERDEARARAETVAEDALARVRQAADLMDAVRADATRAEAEAVAARAAADVLRGVLRGATAGTPGGARPPALHEVLRGDVVAALAGSLPAPAILELRRMAIRSMALDAAPRDRAAARADLEAAAEFLAAAREALPADGSELAEAHLAVALLSIRYSMLPAFEEAARAVVRENAATCARRAESAFAALGVARGRALALDVLGQVALAEGRRPEAAEFLEKAREAFGTPIGTSIGISARAPISALEAAPIERRLAIAWFELGRKPEALALARDSARRAREASPFGSDAELEARRLVVAMIPPDDVVAAGAERVEVGRVLVQLGRPAAAIEPLSEALRRFADDETRFRERLEAAIWIARAMDALGSTEAALRTLEQPRVVADAAIFGIETLLARDHAALRQALRAKVAAQATGR